MDLWLWPFRVGLDLLGGGPAHVRIDWATPNEVVADLTTMRLRAFVSQGDAPVIVVAPYAVHDAGLADLAPGHSVIERLVAEGFGPILLTEWKSATSATRGLSTDAYLADLNAAVDLAPPAPILVGLCQGGWLSLAYAAAFPGKVGKLVAAGAPVDTSCPSEIASSARNVSSEMVEELIAAGGGLVSGRATLGAFRALGSAELAAAEVLQVADAGAPELIARYQAWDARTVDLPGRYYADVLNWIFRDNRLAAGDFPVFGRPTPLSRVTAPIFALAGGRDAVAPPAQVFAALDLVGTPAACKAQKLADCGHLSLFMGARTLAHEWVEIAAWMRS
ncbi:MAG: alpha/beta fold hydrolase [Rhodoblastus sp.]|nr:alpha/beta fold hydrolase [Rhodoblastus sp.]